MYFLWCTSKTLHTQTIILLSKGLLFWRDASKFYFIYGLMSRKSSLPRSETDLLTFWNALKLCGRHCAFFSLSLKISKEIVNHRVRLSPMSLETVNYLCRISSIFRNSELFIESLLCQKQWTVYRISSISETVNFLYRIYSISATVKYIYEIIICLLNSWKQWTIFVRSIIWSSDFSILLWTLYLSLGISTFQVSISCFLGPPCKKNC